MPRDSKTEIAILRRALGLCLGKLQRYEHPGSRETSDEFVTLACIQQGDLSTPVLLCLERSETHLQEKPGLPHPGQQPHHYFCPLCGQSRLFEIGLGFLGCPVCEGSFLAAQSEDGNTMELGWSIEIDTTVKITTEP